MTGDFLAFRLDGLALGVPAMRVREVIRLPAVSRVAGAPPTVAGLINLRGQIIAAIDLRQRLALPSATPSKPMAIVIEADGAPYALIVDSVSDVVRAGSQESPPMTLSPLWREVVLAVQRDDPLVMILDVDALLAPPALAVSAA